MANKNRKYQFFDEDTPHGLVKRIMYKKYIQAYVEKTQNEKFSLRSIFIDGFAGAGRYSNAWPSEIEAYGSPLISLMVVLGSCYKKDMKIKKEKLVGEMRARSTTDLEETDGAKPVVKKDKIERNLWGWPESELPPQEELSRELESQNKRIPYTDLDHNDMDTKISLIFIECKRKRFRSLTVNVELLLIKFLNDNYPSHKYGFSSAEGEVNLILNRYPFEISVKIINRKFEDADPPPALRESDVRSLTFLDPFGFTHTPMSHVKKFAPGPGNEVFINFMSSYVNRFVSRSTEGVKSLYGISDSELEDVGCYYGIDPPDLTDSDGLADFIRDIIRSSNETGIKGNNIRSCTSVYESFLKEKTDSEYSLVFEVKDKNNSILYHMVHITNHIRGVEAMKESMNRCSQTRGEMVMSDYDILRKGHILNFGNLDDEFEVAESIYKRFRNEKAVPIEHIKKFVLFETKYLFRKKALANLQRRELITDVEDTKGNRQKIRNCYPDKDKNEAPIVWLLSFSDENYDENLAITLKAKEEMVRKKEERKQIAREKRKRQEEERMEKEKRKQEQRKRKQAELERKKRKRETILKEQRRKKEAKLKEQSRKKAAKLVEQRRKKAAKLEEQRRKMEAKLEEQKRKREEKLEERRRIKEAQLEEQTRKREAKLEEQKRKREEKLEERRRIKEAQLEEKTRKREAKLEEQRRKEEVENKRMKTQMLITQAFQGSDVYERKSLEVVTNKSIKNSGDVGCHQDRKEAPKKGWELKELNKNKARKGKEKGNKKENMQKGDILRYFSLQKKTDGRTSQGKK